VTVTICTWLWHDGSERSNLYAPKHVNALQSMIARHLKRPHEFVCVADSPEGFSKDVRFFETPKAARKVGELRTPEAAHFPSCYRRLWMFSEEAKAIGERVLLLDIDLVVVKGMDPLFDRTEDFVGWRPRQNWGSRQRFGGGLYLLRTGTRTKVWTEFDGPNAIAKAKRAGYRGSDQAWISYMLADHEPEFPNEIGVYSIRDMKGTEQTLPSDARLIQFNGRGKPWNREPQQMPWVRDNWIPCP
jgi:hypothetical protein